MKKLVSVILTAALFLGSMGNERMMRAQKTELQIMEYENSFLRITAGPDEEAGGLRIFCRNDLAVQTKIYAAYEGEGFNVQGVMGENEGLLLFPEEGSSVDFYIQTEGAEDEIIKSNIVTFFCEDGYYYEMTKDSDGDGIPDGYEIRDLGTSPGNADTDGDGFSDGYEVQVLHTDPLMYTEDGDYDRDGLTNREEMEKGTHPYLADTDFDGTMDKKDKNPLINTGEIVVKEKWMPELKRGYYDIKETRYEADGSVTEIVTNILSGRIQWVNTGENHCRYYYDQTGRKPVAELIKSGEMGEWSVTQLAYIKGQLTDINQNGKQIEIDYAENGRVSRYREEGKTLYEKQYEGGQLSEITYGNGDSIRYQYNRRKAITGMEINGEEAYIWKYNKEGIVTRCTDEREKSVEDYIYDEWLDPVGKVRKNGLSVQYTETEEGVTEVYEAGGEIKEVRKEYSENEVGESSCTVQYPHEVEIRSTQKEGESEKIILYSGKEIVSEEKSEKQKEKVKKEKQKKIKKEKDEESKKKQKKNIKRDESGNIKVQGGTEYDWEGLQLKRYRKQGVEVEYAYDAQGNRTRKTVNGVTSTYGVEDGNLVYEKTGDSVSWYYYGADGLPAAIETEGQMYLYEKDEDGNIIALYNTEGETETEYIYDEKGNLLEIQGNQEAGEVNPFRYQSAYYDRESGLYYSYGRYYDTEEEAFLNADVLYELEPENAESYLSASYYGAGVEEIQIGAARSSYDVPASPQADLLSPTGDNRLYSWAKSCLNYNCYAYAIGRTDDFYEPGELSLGQRLQKVNFHTVLAALIQDFKAKGSDFKFVNKDYKPARGEKMIAYKTTDFYGDGDFHFMKYIPGTDTWRHKPGARGILTYQKNLDEAKWDPEAYDIKSRAWVYDYGAYNSSTVFFVYVSSKQK